MATTTHNLKADGAPFKADGTPVWDDKSTRGTGHAKCSCGDLSPVLGSRAERQRWHKEHKADPNGAGLQPPVVEQPRQLTDTEALDLIGLDPDMQFVVVPFPDNMPKRWHGALAAGARTVGHLAFKAAYITDTDGGVEIAAPDYMAAEATEAIESLFANAKDYLANYTKTDPEYLAAPKVGRPERKALRDLKATALRHYAVGVADSILSTR